MTRMSPRFGAGYVGDFGGVAQPGGLVQHEVRRRDAQRVAAGGELERAVAHLDDELLRRRRRHGPFGHVAVQAAHLCHDVVRAASRLVGGCCSGSRTGVWRALRCAASQGGQRGDAHRAGCCSAQKRATRNLLSHVHPFRSCGALPAASTNPAGRGEVRWQAAGRAPASCEAAGRGPGNTIGPPPSGPAHITERDDPGASRDACGITESGDSNVFPDEKCAVSSSKGGLAKV